MAVLRSVGLTLGLLMALGGSAWAQATCMCSPGGPAGMCDTLNFDGVLIGNSNFLSTQPQFCSVPCSFTASISGPNAIEFAVTGNNCAATVPANTPCSVMVRFTPLGCGVRTATLTLTVTFAGDSSCDILVPLVGFGCSFDCAINATQTAGLSPTTRDRILRELFLAQGSSGAERCFHLNCALCLIVPESLRGRTGAADVEAQIRCLLRVFACAPAL